MRLFVAGFSRKNYASMVSKVKDSMSNQIWGTHQQILQVKMSPCGDFRAWMRNMLVILSPCRPLFGELDKVNSSVCAMFWDSSLMFLSITQTPTRTSGSFAWYHRIPTVTGFLWHFRKLLLVNWSLSPPPPAKNNVREKQRPLKSLKRDHFKRKTVFQPGVWTFLFVFFIRHCAYQVGITVGSPRPDESPVAVVERWLWHGVRTPKMTKRLAPGHKKRQIKSTGNDGKGKMFTDATQQRMLFWFG